MYPRVRNQGYRVDSWPEGGFPGSDFDLMREQLLDEHKVDYGILIPLHGHSFGAEAPEYAGGAVPRRQRVGPRGDARPRRAPAQHDQHRARVARAGRRGDRALRRRPALRPGPAAHDRRVPAGQPQVLAGLRRRRRGRAAARRPHRRPRAALGHGLAVVLPRGARRLRQRDGRGDDELHRRGRLRSASPTCRSCASRPASRGPGRSCGRWTPRGRPCATTCRTSTAGRPSSSASTSGSRRSRSRSPTTPSSSCRRSSSPA